MEVDYGDYEGRTSDEIHRENPDWNLFTDGCPGGETVAEISARADRVIRQLRSCEEGAVLLFSHMHFMRFLTARWIQLPGHKARRFLLSTAALSVLGFEHNLDEPVVRLWNDCGHVASELKNGQ